MGGVGNSFGLSNFLFIFQWIFLILSRIYGFHIGFYYLVYNFGCKKCEVTVKNRREVVYSKTKMVVTKRRGIGPIRTEISPYKIRKKLFIFQIVRYNGICIWQNYFCILPNFGDFRAKTSLFRYLINQKRNNFIKHCSPQCINKPPISEMCIYMRHNLYKWGLYTRGGEQCSTAKNGGRVSLQHMKYVITNRKLHQSLTFW